MQKFIRRDISAVLSRNYYNACERGLLPVGLTVHFYPDWRYYKTKQDRDYKP